MADDDADLAPDDDSGMSDKDFRAWWGQVPDFVKPDYPLDIPPARLPFVRTVFTQMGAAEHCPEARCRRARSCQGGDGPPCYRADRTDLQQVLFTYWATLFMGVTAEEYRHALQASGNKYAPKGAGVAAPAPPVVREEPRPGKRPARRK